MAAQVKDTAGFVREDPTLWVG